MNAPEHMAKAGGPIRVLLVDDHQHVLWGLGKLIAGEWPRMAVAGTASTVSEALVALGKVRADVMVLDVYLAGENSLDRLEELRRSGTPIVVLTGARDAQLRVRAMQGGACAVVLKEEPAAVLLQQIERAHLSRTPGICR